MPRGANSAYSEKQRTTLWAGVLQLKLHAEACGENGKGVECIAGKLLDDLGKGQTRTRKDQLRSEFQKRNSEKWTNGDFGIRQRELGRGNNEIVVEDEVEVDGSRSEFIGGAVSAEIGFDGAKDLPLEIDCGTGRFKGKNAVVEIGLGVWRRVRRGQGGRAVESRQGAEPNLPRQEFKGPRNVLLGVDIGTDGDESLGHGVTSDCA
jgi:hypothetical protein